MKSNFDKRRWDRKRRIDSMDVSIVVPHVSDRSELTETRTPMTQIRPVRLPICFDLIDDAVVGVI